jgi:hypothetical protein
MINPIMTASSEMQPPISHLSRRERARYGLVWLDVQKACSVVATSRFSERWIAILPGLFFFSAALLLHHPWAMMAISKPISAVIPVSRPEVSDIGPAWEYDPRAEGLFYAVSTRLRIIEREATTSILLDGGATVADLLTPCWPPSSLWHSRRRKARHPCHRVVMLPWNRRYPAQGGS